MNKFQEGTFQQFWRRQHLITNNLPVEQIEGVYRVENSSFSDIASKFVDEREWKMMVDYPGSSCDINIYISSPLSMAFQYCSNIFSLEEWTFSTREIQEFRGGLFCGAQRDADNTQNFLRYEAYTDCRAIDHLSAWDQGDVLWMRHYFRMVDARYSINKPGTLLMHVSNYHPYLNMKDETLPDYIKASQNRAGREWLGANWPAFCARQRINMHNLKTILEARYPMP